jgi:N6-L-threonylcarbamoyladenine synthase
MNVLGLETSCDETAVSIVKNGKTILANRIASQEEIHRPFGGVFPELASRHHIDRILPLIEEALEEAHLTPKKIDLIAVANGPGLMGSLLIGVQTAKTLAYAWGKPLIGVNHVEAHLYAAMMEGEPTFPALGVVLSGGHTFLAKVLAIGTYKIIGTTVDDAIGEAFDKVAAMLGLPYPGGPYIETLAKEGDPTRYSFKAGTVKERPLDFSFSGLKTSVLYTIKGNKGKRDDPSLIPEEEKKHIAASFQEASLKDIVKKTVKASHTFPCHAIYLGGGVTNNDYIKRLFEKEALNIPIFWPPVKLSLDNGAMIAGLGFHLCKQFPTQKVEAFPRII